MSLVTSGSGPDCCERGRASAFDEVGSPLLGRTGRRFTAADALADVRCSDTPTRQLVTSPASPVYCQGTRVAMSTEWWDGSTPTNVLWPAGREQWASTVRQLCPSDHFDRTGSPRFWAARKVWVRAGKRCGEQGSRLCLWGDGEAC